MNKILEYQKVDDNLLKIEKKIKASQAQKTIDRENDIANNAKLKIKDLDKRAEELLKEFHSLREIMNNNVKNIEILEKQKIEMQDKERVKKLYDNIKNVNNNLGVIETRLKTLTTQIDSVIKAFKGAQKTIEVSKEKRKHAQEELDNVSKKYETQIADISSQLNKIAKDIDPKMLETYNRLRETKYPPFVQVADEDGQNRCSGCKSIIAVGRMDLLKTNGYIECESCHRIIYLKDKF